MTTHHPGLVAPTPEAVGKLSVDAFALFVAEDERPLSGLGGVLDWLARGGVSKYLLEGHLVGRVGETLLATPDHALTPRRVFFFGLGALAQATEAQFEKQARVAIDTLVRAGVRSVGVSLPERPVAEQSERVLRRVLDESGKLEAWLVSNDAETLPARAKG